MEKSWVTFYQNVMGSKRLLEGNILTQRVVVEVVARFVQQGARVLEIGAGTGVLGAPLAQAGIEVFCLDNEPQLLEMCKVNARTLGVDIKYVEGDAFELPYSADYFTVAYSTGLLEHFSDEDIHRIVRESLRVAPVAVHGVPLVGRTKGAFGNERWMDEVEWEALLRPVGLAEVIPYEDGWSFCGICKREGVEQA